LIGGVLLMLALVRLRRSWQLSVAAAAVVAAATIVIAYTAV
jgi:hypothetical protein